MKKLISLSLVALMLLPLAACGIGGGGRGGASGGNFKYDDDFVKTNMPAEYLLTYKTTNYENGQPKPSSYATTIKTANGYYYESGDEDGYNSGSLYILHDGKYVQYSGTKEEGFTKPSEEEMQWTYQWEPDQIELMAGSGILSYMTYYSTFAELMKPDGTETIAGRKCDKFKASIGLFGVGVQYAYSVDQQTGVCLRFGFAATTPEDSGALTFECTEFQLTGVSLPSYS